jgi:hypothetical protein
MSTMIRPGVAIGCVMIGLVGAGSARAATFTPNRSDDPSVGGTTCTPPAPANGCSLRGAVAATNNGDTVQLSTGTYTLALNELHPVKTITIAGAGPGATTIRQTGPYRVINAAGVGLTVTGATITGGHMVGPIGPAGSGSPGNGGAGGGGNGGGINANGALSLTDVVVTGNVVQGGPGGTGVSGVAVPGKGGNGGAASAAGIGGGNPVTLTRVAITNNLAFGGVGGSGGTAGTTGTGGTGGQAGSALGAGVDLGLGTTLVARDTLISGNQAVPGAGGTGGGGGLTSGPGGVGGQGESADGGGLFSNGVVKLTNVTLSGNLAGGSTGGHGGPGRALAGAAGGAGGLSGGGAGGAVALFNGAAGQFASVTAASNSATDAPGGVGGTGSGGGAAGANGTPGSSQGGNVFVSSATLTMRGSIVALGAGHSGAENCAFASGSAFTDVGHNLDDGHQCIAVATSGDVHDVPAGLGPLQDNGGPTQTRALLSGSAAIGAGGSTCADVAALPLTTDQRGLPRGTPCDIGAFDGQPPVAAAPTVAGRPAAGSTVSCALGASGGDVPQTMAVQWLRDGAPIASASSYGVTSADVGHALSCRLTLTNAFGASTATSAGVTVVPAPPPKPGLKSLKLSPKQPRNKHTETITFSLTGAPAKVTFKLQRIPAGVKVGKRCVAPSRKHRHGKRCSLRPVKANGAPKQFAAKVGANKLTWKPSGLRPGAYRLTATPAGGRAVTVGFTARR